MNINKLFEKDDLEKFHQNLQSEKQNRYKRNIPVDIPMFDMNMRTD